MQTSLSKTTLIRYLSVCVSHLESFSEAPEIIRVLCTKASTHVTRALEEVLEPSSPVVGSIEAQSAISPRNAIDEEDNVQPWIAELESLNFEVFDNFDISMWTNDLEYSGAIRGWTNF